MPGFSFKTTGDAKTHWIQERMPTPPVGPVNVTIVQYDHDDQGASVTGGALSIGIEGALLDVLTVRDGKNYYARSVDRLCWNDNGNVCYFSVDIGGGSWDPAGGGTGGVSSITSANAGITVSPITGNVVLTLTDLDNDTLMGAGFTAGSPATNQILRYNGTTWALATDVISVAAGSGITVSASTGAVTITNNGVRSVTSAGSITVTGTTTTNVEINTAQAETWTSNQTFTSPHLRVQNGTTVISIAANSGGSAQTLTLPDVTDTVAVLGTTQTWGATQIYPSATIQIQGPVSGNSQLSSNAVTTTDPWNFPATSGASATVAAINLAETFTALQTFGTNISFGGIAAKAGSVATAGAMPVSDGTNFSWQIWTRPTRTAVAAPTGHTGTAMVGIAASFTPTVSGNIVAFFQGFGTNNTNGDGFSLSYRYGTGTAPINGAAATGTVWGSTPTITVTTGGQYYGGLAQMNYITGLAVGTAYWFDVALTAVTGGTASLANVSITVWEVP